MSTEFDIAIIGGGPVGATTAALLARHGGFLPKRIALLAPELDDAGWPQGPPELRVAAISRSSQQVLRNALAWSQLPPERLCAYECMRVWHESVPCDGPEVLVFRAAELAEAELGHIVENRALAAASLAAFRAQGGRVIAATISSVSTGVQAVRLETSAGELSARLIVGADGARSQVRELLHLPLRSHDYRQSAIVATVETGRAHQFTAWQRFLADGTLALLPLFDGSCSIVWSVREPRAQELMGLSTEQFNVQLEAASDRVLGRARLLSQRIAVPLQRATAVSLIGERVALVGDAAHVIHPLAGQGVNLGLLDAAALCEVLAGGVAEHEDPGAARLLTRYEQLRLTNDTLMSWSMSAFNEVFARGPGPGGWFAARLLGLAGASGYTRRLFARRAMGLSGKLPRLACGPHTATTEPAAKVVAC
jgi:2-octaprenylphenol hydroxylase